MVIQYYNLIHFKLKLASNSNSRNGHKSARQAYSNLQVTEDEQTIFIYVWLMRLESCHFKAACF